MDHGRKTGMFRLMKGLLYYPMEFGLYPLYSSTNYPKCSGLKQLSSQFLMVRCSGTIRLWASGPGPLMKVPLRCALGCSPLRRACGFRSSGHSVCPTWLLRRVVSFVALSIVCKEFRTTKLAWWLYLELNVKSPFPPTHNLYNWLLSPVS